MIGVSADDAWNARGFGLMQWYAKHFGITDIMIEELDWVKHWVRAHHNSLVYNPITCVWKWRY